MSEQNGNNQEKFKIYVDDIDFEMVKNIFRITSLIYELDPEHFSTNLWTYFFDTFKRTNNEKILETQGKKK